MQINVAMTAYLLTVAVLIPGSGWLSDRYGARGVFSLAIGLFTLASIGCAAAPTLGVLTVVPGAAGHRRRDDGAGRPVDRAAVDRRRPT